MVIPEKPQDIDLEIHPLQMEQSHTQQLHSQSHRHQLAQQVILNPVPKSQQPRRQPLQRVQKTLVMEQQASTKTHHL